MKADKDLYRQLRALTADQLWNEEVPRFEQAPPRERDARVAVIRAVGVVMSATGSAQQRTEVKAWLVRLLKDPSEKVRRYAMAAIPKLRAVPGAESEMIGLLKKTETPRERKYVGRALNKIGGAATLAAVTEMPGVLPVTEQKVRASVARQEEPGAIRMGQRIPYRYGMRVHLRCRRGLAKLLRAEVEEHIEKFRNLRILDVQPEYVVVSPTAPISLTELYRLRCFATVGFSLGIVRPEASGGTAEGVAQLIASPAARELMGALTDGAWRYRLAFIGRSHARGAVEEVAARAFALCPEILNDAQQAPWFMDVHPLPRGLFVEMRPRVQPDPRWWYRKDDVAASSHPPLAAAMVRVAGPGKDEIIWDPFCGAGMELIERYLEGGVTRLFGTDLSAEAVAAARANLDAAKKARVHARILALDFRDYLKLPGFQPGQVSLIISNPPMGRRVRIPDMQALFNDLFDVAACVLKPGGRLVFANPLKLEPRDPTLKLEFRETVDMGGFDVRLERYRKLPSRAASSPDPRLTGTVRPTGAEG